MKKRRKFPLLVLSCVLLLLAAGCAQHRGAPLLSAAPPSAASGDDIYIADRAGRIRALRPDGTEQWTYSLADALVRSDEDASHDLEITYLAARPNNKLLGLATELTGHHAGRIRMFALDSNRLVWQREVPAPEEATAPLAVGDEAIYEAGNDGVLYAFARSDGHALWQYRVSEGALGSPTLGADGTIYITGPQNNLHAISPDGKQRWVKES